LQELSGVDLGSLPLFGSTTIPVAGSSVLVARKKPLGGNGFMLLIEAAALDAVRDALLSAGAVVLDSATYDVLRVEHGYGEYGRELSLEYIPLETGLHDAISFNKGCYVGQEIIARMESRNRLAKSLRGLRLRLPDAAELDEQAVAALALPGKLSVDGKESGDVTSVVISPRFGPIALAYVRSAHAEIGSVVGIADSSLEGEVVDLPFIGA
jgi:folate-binding protein YgfZ